MKKMKFLLFIIIGLTTALRSPAQNQDTVTDIETIYGTGDKWNQIHCVLPVKKDPEFRGGHDSLYCFLENHWKGKLIEDYKSTGILFIRFSIDSLGQVQNIEINPDEIVKRASRFDFVTDKRIKDQVFSAFDNMPDWVTTSGNGQTQFKMILRFPYEKKCEKN